MTNKNKFLDHDGPKPVPTLALDAIHRDKEGFKQYFIVLKRFKNN